MPHDQVIINLPGFEILSTHRESSHVVFKVKCTLDPACPKCGGSNLRLKDTFWRSVRHSNLGERTSELLIKAHKFNCLGCRIYFNQRFPGILPRKRATEPFRREVANLHSDGIPQSTLSKRIRMGVATVERWFLDYLKIKGQELKNAYCPKVLGIDEHFFTRKKGYATTLVDLRKRKVFDVLLGRSRSSLESQLYSLPGRHNVRVVLMDLSLTYRQIAKEFFPRAMIVADRFHVVRLINLSFMEVWKSLDPVGRKHRGLMSLMRRHRHHLDQSQYKLLKKYMQKIPGLFSVYLFKDELMKLMLEKDCHRSRCRKLIPRFLNVIRELKGTGFEALKRLGSTLDDWKEEIVRMWRFSKTNSITEGLHNKIERLQRQACGFRNFKNYRLRVKVMCG